MVLADVDVDVYVVCGLTFYNGHYRKIKFSSPKREVVAEWSA